MLTHLIEWYGGSNPVLDCTRKLTGKVGVIINICSNVGSIPTTVTKAQVDMPIGKAGVLKFTEREFKSLRLQIWQVRFSTPKLNRTCHLCCRYSYLVNIISNKVLNSLLQHNYIGNSLKKYSLYESGKD